MTESADSANESTTAVASAHVHGSVHRDRRLYRALAWVGIVAGVVFTVAVIFFSGLAVGRASGGYHGWHRGWHGGQMSHGGGCPMMSGGRMDPEDMGPGMMRPGPAPSPSPAAPSPTPR